MPTEKPTTFRFGHWIVMLACVAGASACGVSETGLGGATDSGTGGANGGICPAGLTDQASWPVSSPVDFCSRVCGPDGIGVQTCSRTDQATCKGKSGCLCVEAPCVTCANCAFLTMPTCYVPTNPTAAVACADGVAKGGACAPACERRLCLRKDGKTACVCNNQGKWACGDWSDSGWK